MLPQAVFQRPGERLSFVEELGLRLGADVNIHSEDWGRVMTRRQHIGKGSPHREYSEWWKERIRRWSDKNPRRRVIRQADVIEMAKTMPEHLKKFNQQGQPAGLTYGQWGRKRASVSANRSALKRKGITKGKLLGVAGNVLDTASLALEEWGAKGERDRMRGLYRERGYSDEEIEALVDTRIELEYRSQEFVTWPFIIPNSDYDPDLEDYLKTIPEDVLIPEGDVEWLREALDDDGSVDA